ncbi:hypothetical protein [Bacteroides gallinarum]|uniref:hypothetical protein n=1 Tax=Bacteroides gallinarum TaxID=376806 RepID=UPI000FE14132
MCCPTWNGCPVRVFIRGADHKAFWGTILPINHPFWSAHRPGDRWNCKCSLAATDGPPTAAPRSDRPEDRPAPGLDSNPGVDGRLFSDTHPYIANAYEGATKAAGGLLEPVPGKGFVPAASMEEVRTRLGEMGIGKIDTGLLSLEQANNVLDALECYGGKFEGLKEFSAVSGKRMREITSVKDAGACLVTGDDGYRLFYNAEGSETSSYKAKLLSHEESLKRYRTNLESLRMQLEQTQERVKKAKGSIKRMLKQDVSSLLDNIVKVQRKIRDKERAISNGEEPLYDVTTQMYPNIADQLKSVIHHEIGHYMDQRLGKVSERLRVKPASTYGKSAYSENFAEWNAIYRMEGEKGVPAEMLEAFRKYDEMIKKGGEG